MKKVAFVVFSILVSVFSVRAQNLPHVSVYFNLTDRPDVSVTYIKFVSIFPTVFVDQLRQERIPFDGHQFVRIYEEDEQSDEGKEVVIRLYVSKQESEENRIAEIRIKNLTSDQSILNAVRCFSDLAIRRLRELNPDSEEKVAT